jgi:excisionase family DNA binding protein
MTATRSREVAMAQTRTDLTHGVQGTPGLLVPAEAAEFLRISIGQLYHLTSAKKVPHMKLGGQLRFEHRALMEFVAAHTIVLDEPAASPANGGSRKAASRGSSRVIHRDAEASGPRFTFKTPKRAH